MRLSSRCAFTLVLMSAAATAVRSKHAIGLTSEAGTELLIHVGINTVELNGQHFTQLKETGAKVRKGEKILEFDNDAIKAAGYDTTVVVVASAPESVEIKKTGEVKELDEIFAVK